MKWICGVRGCASCGNLPCEEDMTELVADACRSWNDRPAVTMLPVERGWNIGTLQDPVEVTCGHGHTRRYSCE